MRINELLVESKQLNEGPIDVAKQIGAGFKGFKQGGFAGAKAGYTAQGAANTQVDANKAATSELLKQWAAYAQNVKTSSDADPTVQQATDWFAKNVGKKPAGAPANPDPAAVSQWLEKEIAGVLAAGGKLPATSSTNAKDINAAGPKGTAPARQQTGAERTAMDKMAQATAGDSTDQVGQTVYAQVKAMLPQLDKKGKQRILTLLQKSLGQVTPPTA